MSKVFLECLNLMYTNKLLNINVKNYYGYVYECISFTQLCFFERQIINKINGQHQKIQLIFIFNFEMYKDVP